MKAIVAVTSRIAVGVTCSVSAFAWLCPCCRALSCFLRAAFEACTCWHRCSSLCASSLLPAAIRASSSKEATFELSSFFFSSNCKNNVDEFLAAHGKLDTYRATLERESQCVVPSGCKHSHEQCHRDSGQTLN